jgi:hypothetical protein
VIALPYIDKLAAVLPLDAEAIRAEFLWRDKKPQEATETLEQFIRGLRDDPWPAHDLIRRSMSRAEAIAKTDRSKTASLFLYNALRLPFCVFNNQGHRLATTLGIATYLDGDHPGYYTLPVIDAFEPHILWQKKFLEVRKACYSSLQNPRAAQASRDLDDFMRQRLPRPTSLP